MGLEPENYSLHKECRIHETLRPRAASEKYAAMPNVHRYLCLKRVTWQSLMRAVAAVDVGTEYRVHNPGRSRPMLTGIVNTGRIDGAPHGQTRQSLALHPCGAARLPLTRIAGVAGLAALASGLALASCLAGREHSSGLARRLAADVGEGLGGEPLARFALACVAVRSKMLDRCWPHSTTQPPHTLQRRCSDGSLTVGTIEPPMRCLLGGGRSKSNDL